VSIFNSSVDATVTCLRQNSDPSRFSINGFGRSLPGKTVTRVNAFWRTCTARRISYPPWPSSPRGEMIYGKKEWRCGSEAGRRQILRSRYPQQFAGRQYSASERKEIDALMRQRDRLLARMPKIEDRSSCYSEGRGCHHEALFGDARSNPGRHQGL
jgi:hypothetical protein